MNTNKEIVNNIQELKTDKTIEPILYRIDEQSWAVRCCNGFTVIKEYGMAKLIYDYEKDNYLEFLSKRRIAYID